MAWGIVTTKQLTEHLLSSLTYNEIAAIRIPNFISADLNSAMLKRIQSSGFEIYSDEPEMAKIGLVQGEHIHGEEAKRRYFSQVKHAVAARKEIILHDPDPLHAVMNMLATTWGYKAEIAFEEVLHQHYFAGLIRIINRSLMHFDWAPHDAKGWTIEQVSVQFACNIYLQTDSGGGMTRIYRRPWLDTDEAYRQHDSYSYQRDIVEGCEMVELVPHAREFVLFNSRNYHEVLSTLGNFQRISMSSFVGFCDSQQKLLFWS